MDKFRFLKWQAYKDSQKLLTEIIKIAKKLPREYRFELGSQIIRSSLSVVLNIAEGSGKNSDRELRRYMDISLGSLYETLAGVDSLKINKLIDEEEFDIVYGMVNGISKQLGGFKKRINQQLPTNNYY